ncbi:MAG: FAD assembly factor SdhE [Sodalis sp. (in: enterobacteria)]
MDIKKKMRVYWACRRGMRELDIPIMLFFEYDFDALENQDKEIFIQLLECDDADLFNWLMNQDQPDNHDYRKIISMIQKRKKSFPL